MLFLYNSKKNKGIQPAYSLDSSFLHLFLCYFYKKREGWRKREIPFKRFTAYKHRFHDIYPSAANPILVLFSGLK